MPVELYSLIRVDQERSDFRCINSRWFWVEPSGFLALCEQGWIRARNSGRRFR